MSNTLPWTSAREWHGMQFATSGLHWRPQGGERCNSGEENQCDQ